MHSDAGGSIERLSRASPQRLGQAKLELLGSAAKDLAAGPGNPIITAIFSLACSSQNCDELFERWGHQTQSDDRMSSFDAAAWRLLVFSWSRKWLTCNEAMVRNSADTCPAALQAAQLAEKSPVTASSHGNCSVHRLPKRAHALCADIPGSLGQSSVQRALAEKNLSLRTKFLSRGPLESEGRLNKPQRCGLSKELETFEHRAFDISLQQQRGTPPTQSTMCWGKPPTRAGARPHHGYQTHKLTRQSAQKPSVAAQLGSLSVGSSSSSSAGSSVAGGAAALALTRLPCLGAGAGGAAFSMFSTRSTSAEPLFGGPAPPFLAGGGAGPSCPAWLCSPAALFLRPCPSSSCCHRCPPASWLAGTARPLGFRLV